jgi:methionine-rich copper-binding protein CopC
MNWKLLALAGGLAVIAASAQAEAHARLLMSDPAANATGRAPKQLTLRFSEKLNPKFSGLTVTRPQIKNAPAPMTVAVSKDRQSLVATPTQPLAGGVYKVTWHAVSADTHRVQGTYSFTVK